MPDKNSQRQRTRGQALRHLTWLCTSRPRRPVHLVLTARPSRAPASARQSAGWPPRRHIPTCGLAGRGTSRRIACPSRVPHPLKPIHLTSPIHPSRTTRFVPQTAHLIPGGWSQRREIGHTNNPLTLYEAVSGVRTRRVFANSRRSLLAIVPADGRWLGTQLSRSAWMDQCCCSSDSDGPSMSFAPGYAAPSRSAAVHDSARCDHGGG